MFTCFTGLLKTENKLTLTTWGGKEADSIDMSHLKFSTVLHTSIVAGRHNPSRLIFWRYPGRPASFHFDRNEVGKQSRSITQLGPTRREVTPHPTLTQPCRDEGGREGGGDRNREQEGVRGKATETKSVHNIQCIMSALQNGCTTSPRVEIIMAWQQQWIFAEWTDLLFPSLFVFGPVKPSGL